MNKIDLGKCENHNSDEEGTSEKCFKKSCKIKVDMQIRELQQNVEVWNSPVECASQTSRVCRYISLSACSSILTRYQPAIQSISILGLNPDLLAAIPPTDLWSFCKSK